MFDEAQHVNQETQALGDPHNFGARVHRTVRGGIFKPRPVDWEYLIFDSRSPVRALLDEEDCFFFLPYLTVDRSSGEFFSQGEVEELIVDGLGDGDFLGQENDLLIAIGRLIALSMWFGLSDLHVENIMIGKRDGQLVVAPIDLECAMFNVKLPSQTFLIPLFNNSFNLIGLKYVLKAMKNENGLASLLFGYLTGLSTLEAKAGRINEEILNYEKHDPLTSRIVLKPTRLYVKALRDRASEEYRQLELYERIQIDRGDIPYFYRNVRDADVHFVCMPNKSVSLAEYRNINEYAAKFRFIDQSGLHVPEHSLRYWYLHSSLQIASSFRPYLGFSRECSQTHEGLLLSFSHEKLKIDFHGKTMNGLCKNFNQYEETQ